MDIELSLVVGGVWIVLLSLWVRTVTPSLIFTVIPAIGLYVLTLIVHLQGKSFIQSLGTGANAEVWRSDSIQLGSSLALLASVAMVAGVAYVGTQHALVSHFDLSRDLDVTLPATFNRVMRLRAPAGSYNAVAAVALAFFIFIYGPLQLLQRDVYLATYAIAGLSSVGVLVFPVVALSLTIASAQAVTSTARILTATLAVLTILVVLSTGSRVLAVLPVIYLATRATFRLRVGPARILIAALFSVLGLSLALSFRGSLVGHGLIPYATIFVSDPLGAIAKGLYSAIANIAFSVPLMGAVSLFGTYSLNDFWISISPLPGSAAGWDAISSQLGLNKYVPYSGFGELAYISPALLVIFCFTFSAAVAWVMDTTKSQVLKGLIAILYAYSFILLLQYNLRSSFRVIYVIIALFVVYAVQALLKYLARRRADEAI